VVKWNHVASGRQHRRHRSRAEADQLVTEYETSGVTQAECCRQKDPLLKTLARYLARYREQSARGSESHESQRLVAVEVAYSYSSGSKLTWSCTAASASN
jgi:hypothetical protein